MRKYFSKYSIEMVKEDDNEYKSKYEGKISTREYAYEKFLEVFRLDKKAEEHFVMFGLNSKNDIIAAFLISKGTLNSASVNITDLVKRIVLCNCQKIIVAHNHPSGDTTPSTYDIDVTKKIRKVCELIGIDFLDHLVIGNKCYQAIEVN